MMERVVSEFVEGHERTLLLPHFDFESGEQLHEMKVGYVTHGELNARKDNAILLLPGATNTRHSAEGYIGPGNALDPQREFIIAVDAIGAGTSSRPGDGLGAAFPRYNIRDMVRAQHHLVTSLGLTRLKAVVGASMGSFQALEWTIQFPNMMDKAVLMVPAACTGNVMKSVVRAMIEIIELDPDWNDGRPIRPPLRGLRAAGRIYYPWSVTDAYIERLAPQELEREITDRVERAASWNVWDLIRRYQAVCAHDVALPFDGDMGRALERIRARLLVLPTTTDRLICIQSARDIARNVQHATYVEVPTDLGHLGWRPMQGAPETTFIANHVIRFLDGGYKQ